ncbi:hypothetical protein F5050DRAFT_1802859 [Lentinula boryana]|uniref:Uncharacterized protein n=1 Tax=Lentinula boryana TaxID=40481 RepID=A0ABQ8QT87_9AGAR|nr:hypothetical protein F5050DRAFT_1802859 [Lentinula boryana]
MPIFSTTTIPASSPFIKYSQHWNPNKTDGSMITDETGVSANLISTGLDSGSPAVFDASNFGERSEIDNFVFYQSDPHVTSGDHLLGQVLPRFSLNPQTLSASVFPTSSLSSSPSDKPQPLVSNTSKINIGVIFGGIFTVLALLAGLLACWLLHRRRKQKTAHYRATIQPFVVESYRPAVRSPRQKRPQKSSTPKPAQLSSTSAPTEAPQPQPDMSSIPMTVRFGPPPSYTTNPRS